VWTLRDGKLARLQVYLDTAEADGAPSRRVALRGIPVARAGVRERPYARLISGRPRAQRSACSSKESAGVFI
jgi:hypothetical protein